MTSQITDNPTARSKICSRQLQTEHHGGGGGVVLDSYALTRKPTSGSPGNPIGDK